MKAFPAGLRSLLSDRWILVLLLVGLLLRVGIGLGLHHHFRNANPPHVWQGTDEALYYTCGKRSAEFLKSDGWKAFIEAPPRPEYLNWVFFKYTGLILYAAGDSPLALRVISVVLEMAGIALLLGAFAPRFERRSQRLFFTGLLCFFPSFAFWSALAIKEGAILFLTGLLCLGMTRFWKHATPWPALVLAAGICLALGSFRIWAGIGFFLLIASILLIRHPGRPKLLHVVPMVLTVIVGLWFIPSVQFLLTRHILGWETKIMPIRKQVEPDSPAIDRLGSLEGGTFSIPVKAALAWVLPVPGVPGDNALVSLSGFENVAFLGLCLLAYAGMRRKLAPLEWMWLFMGLMILAMAILFGTDLGTIYRSKIAALPFIAYFAACALPRALDSVRDHARTRAPTATPHAALP